MGQGTHRTVREVAADRLRCLPGTADEPATEDTAMTAQEGLFTVARQGGLYRRFVADGAVNHAGWMRAVGTREFVGECRQCGGCLAAEKPSVHRGRTDYTARCTAAACRSELVAPGGRLAKPKRF
jgi:hypothetical protein